MALDPSIILGAKPIQIDSPLALAAQAAQLQALQSHNALSGIQMQQAQRDFADQAAIRNALTALGPNATQQDRANALYGTGTPSGLKLGGEMAMQGVDINAKNARASRDTSTAAKNAQDMLFKAVAQHRDDLVNVTDPTTAAQWIKAGYADPTLAPVISKMRPMEDALASIPTDPTAFQQWKAQNALGATKYIEANAPKTTTANTGGAVQLIQTPGLGGPPTIVGTLPRTVSPDAALSASTSRANTAAHIGAQYKIAGLDQQGNFTGGDGGPFKGLVDAIGNYETPQATALARTPPAVKSQILEAVKQQYPGYDPQQFVTAQATAKSFAPGGKDGQQIEAGNTALNHIATLRQLSAAQAQHNIPLFNKIANDWAKQSGQSAPTNMASAVTLVGPEISKAVVGAGGGQGDREKVDTALQAIVSGSPTQSAGAISTIEDIFGGRLTEKARSYQRGSGKQDFADKFLSPAAQTVLAAKSAHGGKAATGTPAITNAKGWTLHTDASGNKAYVSPDGKSYEEVK